MFGKEKFRKEKLSTSETTESNSTNKPHGRIEVIEDALLDSVSGGVGLALGDIGIDIDIDIDIDPPICVGTQFCRLRFDD